jgi:hypothetical protein
MNAVFVDEVVFGTAASRAQHRIDVDAAPLPVELFLG